ncbi:MAG: heme A synthase [Alphaproteobacteria bacterium]|nr:heme A synthase [Alphaproteobacteria bacterium]
MPAEAVGRRIATWLLGCAGLVFVMVVLGGLTRLTHSGLSIVEWKLVSGILPPLSEAAWQASFEAYQRFPEYRQLNRGMTLADYKDIYWLEYLHRLLGRAIGLVYVVPLVYFAVTATLGRALLTKLGLLLVLGGAQGVLGWLMVASGLVDRPDVSHYRLAAHLGLAVVIFGALLWVALDLRATPSRRSRATLPLCEGEGRERGLAGLALALVFVTIVSGALVAGLDAGLVYNTFPLIEGEWLPAGLLAEAPWYLNFVENRMTIQFQHRWLALATAALVCFLWWRGRAGDRAGRWRDIALGLALLQVGLGIATLVLAVPIGLGVLHQANALLLFGAMVAQVHALGRREATP